MPTVLEPHEETFLDVKTPRGPASISLGQQREHASIARNTHAALASPSSFT